MNKEKTAKLTLRIGLALVFIYVGISSLLSPIEWIGFIPGFIDNIIPAETFLMIHGVVDIILGLWLISGFKTFYSASIAALTLIGIIMFNLSATSIIVRDIGLLAAAIALATLYYEE